MVKIYDGGVYCYDRNVINDNERDIKLFEEKSGIRLAPKETLAQNTLAYGILKAHNTSGNMKNLKIKFDAMASHDITYVGIIQTARASGLKEFPLPYVLTNCHNSLCAVGGTINEDDHAFGLSAAKRYGGIYVPAHFAVIHQYMREMLAGGGKMILGSDSHTRYGALGTMAIGEGGGELAKQLLNKTYDIAYPRVVGVYLAGEPKRGVGPMDVALAIIKEVFATGFVKNSVLEFIGDGIKRLSVDFRNGIDVMTTETTCLSSIWVTDKKVADYLALHGRANDYAEMPEPMTAYYDGMIFVNLNEIEPMIAMPFHPSNVYTVRELNENLSDILNIVEKSAAEQLENPELKLNLKDKVKGGKLLADQAVIAGCAGGTYENICDTADILENKQTGADEFWLSVYPSSQPVFMKLVENGTIARLMQSGASIRSAFCGPCFGAGDVPFNNALSIRHTTRNFPNREGSKPTNGQIASVALMDARSIAATAANKGVLTSAADLDINYSKPPYTFNSEIYKNRVYSGYKKADNTAELKLGPNITDWPAMPALEENLLLKVAAFITDPVTTTDELIPSGETSSYRSNPLALAQFTLSRKDPDYVARAVAAQKGEGISAVLAILKEKFSATAENTGIGSLIYANKPGDGSAREQAASCQKVLSGRANIAREYATKRYRSNLVNWGMLPFIIKDEPPFKLNDYIFIPNIAQIVKDGADCADAYVIGDNTPFKLYLPDMTKDEREIVAAGCLINYYR